MFCVVLPRLFVRITVMEWTKCRTTKLIELFEQESVLWNVRSAHHKNSNSRVDALQRIAEALGSKSDEIEKKLHNIRSQYLREKTKIEKSKKSGAGASDVYVPKWCYYSLLSFLSNSIEKLPHTSSLNLNLVSTILNIYDGDFCLILFILIISTSK